MNETRTALNLLEKVNIINKKYDEIAELTGEKFNIFNILKVERSEVHTHSAILGELLNPKGSHGQKDLFLRLFIKVLPLHYADENLPNDSCRVFIEKSTGRIDEEYTEGGRIDILIEWGKNAIIIENKIDASDQYKQLSRYYNYGLKNHNNNFKLLYLTKNGDNPEGFTTGADKEVLDNTISVSYKKNIIEWLEHCKKEASSLPILRETITQYIYLIKKITNQTINNKMSEELQKLITNSADNFNAAQSILNEAQKAKEAIFNHYWKIVSEEILEFLGEEWDSKEIVKDAYMFYHKKCEIVGFAFDTIRSNNMSLRILKNQHLSINKNTAYRPILDSTAMEFGFTSEDISDWWIGRFQLDSAPNLFSENSLNLLLPLSKIDKNNSLVSYLFEQFKIFYSSSQIREYLKKVNDILLEDYQQLEEIKSKLSKELVVSNWEDHVIYIEKKISGVENQLVIDIKVINKVFNVEVFFRNNNDVYVKDILEKFLSKYNDKIKTERGFFIPIEQYATSTSVAEKLTELLIAL